MINIIFAKLINKTENENCLPICICIDINIM